MTEATETRPEQASADLHASIDQVQGKLAEFDKISAGLAAIEKAHPKDIACAVTTAVGMKQAIAGRAAWRTPRLALEEARVAAKAPVLALGREIDAFAGKLKVQLLEGEKHYDDQIKAEEARKEAEREEKARKEAARVQAIRDRIHTEFVGALLMMDGATAAELEEEIKRLVAVAVDAAAYQELELEAVRAKEAALVALRGKLERVAAREAEEKRLAAEREELARQRAQQEAEDALVASIHANASRIEGDSVAYVQKAINYFESGARDLDGDPRPRVIEALATARRQMADRLAAAQERERIEADRKALAAERAEQQRQEAEARSAREKADREDRARRDEEDRLAREARAAEDQRLAAERTALESRQREAREAEERQQTEARRVEQERLDTEAAQRRQREDEEAAARRQQERQQEHAKAAQRALAEGAGPAMLAILQHWQAAEKAKDKVALQAARVERDVILKTLDEAAP